MTDYKEQLYSKYYSAHTKNLYGEASLDEIQKQFIFWKYYYSEFLPLSKETRVLDIGCGNGGFIYWLQNTGYKNAYGVDVSPEQVEIARDLSIKNIIQEDLREFLKDKEDTYDAIFARDVLEHFRKEEIMEMLKLIHKALKGGGRFVIQTPNGESPLSGRYRYWDFTHEIAFTRSSLSQILITTGFREVKIKPTGPVPHGIKSWVRYFLWKGIEGLLSFYMLIETGQKEGVFTQNIIACGMK